MFLNLEQLIFCHSYPTASESWFASSNIHTTIFCWIWTQTQTMGFKFFHCLLRNNFWILRSNPFCKMFRYFSTLWDWFIKTNMHPKSAFTVLDTQSELNPFLGSTNAMCKNNTHNLKLLQNLINYSKTWMW